MAIGLLPSSIGNRITVAPVEPSIPLAGVKVTLSQGSPCEAMPQKNRTTTIIIKVINAPTPQCLIEAILLVNQWG